MKNLKIVTVVAIALYATVLVDSCNKLECDGSALVSEQEIEDIRIPVHMRLGGNSATKSTTITDKEETAVRNVQLFVFDAEGKIESYKEASDTTVITVDVTAGFKHIYAFVNAPQLKSVSEISDFDSYLSNLTDNSKESFVMVGADTSTVVKEKDITINVQRLVSKVRINKITTAFTSASLASEQFSVDSIYVVNVASDAGYFTNDAPSSWLNKQAWHTSAVDDLLSEKIKDVVLTNNSSYSKEHSFYVYPNPTSEDNSDVLWSPRHTRLVVQATLRGKTVYYPMTLPVLERNKCYTISELIITRPGSDSPDEPVSIQTCTFKLKVMDWDMSLSPYTETI